LKDLEYVKISVNKNGNGYSEEGNNEPSGGASY